MHFGNAEISSVEIASEAKSSVCLGADEVANTL